MATIQNHTWKDLYNNQEFCDLEFHVGAEAKAIKAHKLILAVSSPVFAQLFFPKPANEKYALPGIVRILKDGIEVIQLPKESADVIGAILNYIYTNNPGITDDNVLPLLAASKTYEFPSLVEQCNKYLRKSLKTETALQLYNTLPEGEELNQVNKYIEERTATVIKNPKFEDLPKEKVVAIVADDHITASELELFEAVKTWGASQCKKLNPPLDPAVPDNIRQHVAEVVGHIRFPLMTMKDFVLHVADSGILAEEDVISLFTYFASTPDGGGAGADTKKKKKQPPPAAAAGAAASATNDFEVAPEEKVKLPFSAVPRKPVAAADDDVPLGDDETIGLAGSIFLQEEEEEQPQVNRTEAEEPREEESDEGFNLFD